MISPSVFSARVKALYRRKDVQLIMATSNLKNQYPGDRRKYQRTLVDFPVVLRIAGKTVLGQAVNGCNEGLLVESYLGLRAGYEVVGMLFDRPLNAALQFTTDKKAYKTNGELRHFHLDYLGGDKCKVTTGFFIPSMELPV
jgi:hypothetical protein